MDLLLRIPLWARVVLDVGCGAGDLLSAFRRLSPAARLLGIDKDPVATAVAATRLDEVVTSDVENDPMPFDVPEGIDCIIYGDILEHLKDPWPLIRRHAEALTPDGVMVICVPNIEHWSFADRLLRGTWDYEPSGLLDETHLRWFSLDSMRRGLTNTGLSLCDVHPRVFDAERAEQFAAALAPALTALGVDIEAYKRRAAPLQYIWRVRREPRERLLLTGNMLAPVGGVSHVRVLQPLQAMGTDPQISVNVTDRIEIGRPADESPRIFILHRPSLSGTQGRQMLRMLMDAGYLVVTEFDDHPDFFQSMQDDDQLSFRGVHAVQTSTPALAAVLRRQNPEVAVFPNAIASLPDVHNFADSQSLTCFFGALNREQDWRALMPAINAVAAVAGARLKFQVVHDGQFFEALETPYKAFTPICDYETYMGLLGRCEISLMPLDDNAFNRAKSDLKFIEAGACRVTPLASSVVYGDSIDDGRTGLLFRDGQELQSRLLRLAAMPELAREIGDAARQYVAGERMLAYQVAVRLAWYRSLWARREVLTVALNTRI
ncbi:MAG TPA: methyltransferase domain-containing protein, partial [Acetobacteraceae bacterium]